MASSKNGGKVKTKSARKSLKFREMHHPDAPPSIQKASTRYVTVEPILILIAVGGGVILSVMPQLLRYTIAMNMNVTLPESGRGMNGSCVEQNQSNPYYLRLQAVQADVAFWQMVISLCGNIPSLIVSPFWGAWSDLVGRKICMGLIVVGNIAETVILIIVVYLELPLWILAISSFLTGFLGGFWLILAQCVAYVADVTAEKTRLLRISIVQGAPVLGYGLTQLGVGYMIQHYGFGPPLWMACIAYCVTLLYIVSPLLIETVDRKHKRDRHDIDKEASSVMAGVKNLIMLFKSNVYLRRWRIGFLYTIEFMNELFNTSSVRIAIIYGLGPPFCFSSVLVAGYTTLVIFSYLLSVSLFTKGFSLFLTDFWNLQISMVFAILNGYIHAYVNTSLGLFIAAFVGCLRGMSQALIPTMIAKIVNDNEHGVVFAFEASVTNLGQMLSPVLLNNIYRSTVQTQPNFVFIMLGTLSFLPMIGTAILQVITRYAKRMGQQDKEAAEGMVAMVDMGTSMEQEEI
ncbi:lysosomal proton-coupled steroid conjugate and bile acid symporter SLC46A3-like [Amphiura filiformis]|uniref:lysosomal proton-coupled steroid conjugate and bile acid symporter SLC46A3-like n=1 Tax=Amphiura filiformis TaxID=82378 RepID=UPI003B221B9C